MGKRLKNVTEARQQNWFENHRNSYESEELTYEPFWRTDDIRSYGVKTKIAHFNTRHRIVHLLSQNELWMYLQLVRHPLVLEIYEQFAVPLELSIPIAEALNVKHPVYPDTKVPIIQTIDFMCDMLNPETGEIYKAAFPVKQPEDAIRYRTMEKLALQEAYCELEDIQYDLVSSDALRTIQSKSLECLYRYRELPLFLTHVSKRWLSNFFGHLTDDPHEKVAHLIQRSAKTTGLDYETSVQIFYNALWHKQIDMNWTEYLKLELPASDMGVRPNV